MTTSSATTDENFIKMAPFALEWLTYSKLVDGVFKLNYLCTALMWKISLYILALTHHLCACCNVEKFVTSHSLARSLAHSLTHSLTHSLQNGKHMILLVNFTDMVSYLSGCCNINPLNLICISWLVWNLTCVHAAMLTNVWHLTHSLTHSLARSLTHSKIGNTYMYDFTGKFLLIC